MIPADVQKQFDALERRIRDLETGRMRFASEIREEIAGMVAGIQNHVDAAVQAALKPFLERLAKLDQIAEDAAANRAHAEEARQYRLERELRERVAIEQREKEDRETKRQRDALELTKLAQDVKDDPIERSFKRRNATIALFVTLLVALAGLIGAAIGSHQ